MILYFRMPLCSFYACVTCCVSTSSSITLCFFRIVYCQWSIASLSFGVRCCGEIWDWPDFLSFLQKNYFLPRVHFLLIKFGDVNISILIVLCLLHSQHTFCFWLADSIQEDFFCNISVFFNVPFVWFWFSTSGIFMIGYYCSIYVLCYL